MFRLGRQLATAGRAGLTASTPGRRPVSESVSHHAGPSTFPASSGAASTSSSSLSYPSPDSIVHEPWGQSWIPRATPSARQPPSRVLIPDDHPRARPSQSTAQPRRNGSQPARVTPAALSQPRPAETFVQFSLEPEKLTNADVLTALGQNRADHGIDVLTSNEGDSPLSFDPSTPSSASALRKLGHCAFDRRRERSPVSHERLEAFVRYVLRRELRNPWVLLYALAIASHRLRSATLESELATAIRGARDSWSEEEVKGSFEADSRLKQTIQADLDVFRQRLPLDIRLSWDPILQHDNALGHCLRLIDYLDSSGFARESATDILAYINPGRQSDMDEHPFAVIFLLEALRQAKGRDTEDAQAGAVFDATVALLPELAESWQRLRGVAFRIRNAKRQNLPRTDKHVVAVYAAAEKYLAGPLLAELGPAALDPWTRGGFLLAEGETEKAMGVADTATEARLGADR